MNNNTLLPFVLGVSLASTSPAEEAAPVTQVTPVVRPIPTRVYTNDDLDRVRPFRDELGARSVPAVSDHGRETAAGSPGRAITSSVDRGEAYWRREAEKLRDRVRNLADQRETLRARVAERREDERRELGRGRGSRGTGTESQQTLEKRIAAIERRMRELEEDLAERARRAGALPGWLR